ncbi:phage tail sheath family protein [Mastigocoleus testarum]|uniref:Phage tail protein n=1 Tax=Mastigocoleus testarum BC008 TaxID=371196 RepID=A0A0V7ZWM5_9CYAN|nr:phage tail sheath subtilisin-like domain-containing protein [Mastigocoleus testarum]KST68639.1 phage tail protein [Mastigocoleus testarum BC008]
MQTLITPGVYREDIFPQERPELLTGIPVFLGFTVNQTTKEEELEKFKINQPQELTLFTQFSQLFGSSKVDSYLYNAVLGFFENGGQICYVLPLNPNLGLESALAQGLEVIESLETIDLVCFPDLMRGKPDLEQVIKMQKAILNHCQNMGDRFAILDSLNASTLEEIQQQQQQLNSDYGALYCPWIKVVNATLVQTTSDFGYIPPCGHVAGLYAHQDRTSGVHQAPANKVLEGVLNIGMNISQSEQATLNPKKSSLPYVNCIRAFPGRGIRIWGAYTLSYQPKLRYITVKRLIITIGRWVERNLTDVSFEPNNIKLWIRIEREVSAYLQSLFFQGALKGSTPEEAFYVKCDDETNPTSVQDEGKVVTEIGVAPTVPSEFIVVRLIHGATGVTTV